MKEILAEDECNDTYGRIRMYQALTLKQPENVDIPSERTVYRIMEEIGISHHPRRKPNGITKADREARKSDDLLKRDFHAEEPLTKCVTDITEMKASDGKLYVSAIFDCFDSSVIGLAMDTNMKAPLCVQTLENTANAYPGIRGAIIHSDYAEEKTMPENLITSCILIIRIQFFGIVFRVSQARRLLSLYQRSSTAFRHRQLWEQTC